MLTAVKCRAPIHLQCFITDLASNLRGGVNAARIHICHHIGQKSQQISIDRPDKFTTGQWSLCRLSNQLQPCHLFRWRAFYLPFEMRTIRENRFITRRHPFCFRSAEVLVQPLHRGYTAPA